MFNEIIKPALILCLVCAIMTGTLAYVNSVTEPIIKENARKEEQVYLSNVIQDVDSFSDAMTYDDLKTQAFVFSDSVEKVYEAYNGQDLVGYVVFVTPKGYGGEIKMLVGIGIDQTIRGVSIASHNETPGLGDKAVTPDFTNQFVGGIPQKDFFVVKRGVRDDNEIQAVAAATTSSEAVTAGVIDAVNLVRSMQGGN